uniref:Uncharacterized protein n=1 Tax=viral metagenome TaxID=1070528 RepID=A0A6M3LCV6_9ZZZZ
MPRAKRDDIREIIEPLMPEDEWDIITKELYDDYKYMRETILRVLGESAERHDGCNEHSGKLVAVSMDGVIGTNPMGCVFDEQLSDPGAKTAPARAYTGMVTHLLPEMTYKLPGGVLVGGAEIIEMFAPEEV